MSALKLLKQKIYSIIGIIAIAGFLIVIFLLINFFYEMKQKSNKLNENLIQSKIIKFNLSDFEKIKNKF